MKETATSDDCRSIEIKAEFLTDYLAARCCALRLSYYRERSANLKDVSHINWIENRYRSSGKSERASADISEVNERGDLLGSSVAVFHMGRTDVDFDEDVPVFDDPTDSNVQSSQHSFTHRGQRFYSVRAGLWREEWIDPAKRSVRIRGDEPIIPTTFVVEASGERMQAAELNNEDIGRYLWFGPELIDSMIRFRDGGLQWYTEQTGQVCCTPAWPTYFGVNKAGLLNVYAYDIAKLPYWQQQIWAAFNLTPNGGVSEELMRSQMEGYPSSTSAPERNFELALSVLDVNFEKWTGSKLFTSHEAVEQIRKSIHRFRGKSLSEVLSLSKDIARLTADSFNLSAMHKIAPPPKGERRGSLKSLEHVLATIVDSDLARKLLTPLVGAYDLRLGDAHLPSSSIDDAFKLVEINRDEPFQRQAFTLIANTSFSLLRIADVFKRATNG